MLKNKNSEDGDFQSLFASIIWKGHESNDKGMHESKRIPIRRRRRSVALLFQVVG